MKAYEIVRVLLETEVDAVAGTPGRPTIYRVVPLTRSNCDCPDCRAGKHLYELQRWRDNRWQDAAVSLQGYRTAEEARHHYWGIRFESDAVWEDGTPVEGREAMQHPQPKSEEPYTGPMVPLNTDALRKSAKALEKHWCPVDDSIVRLPPRSHRWVAVYTGVEPGTQITRSTGLTDRSAALDLAKQWEEEARQERRRRARERHSSGFATSRLTGAYLTQQETALILGLSERAVRNLEKSGLRKILRHPIVRAIQAEYESSCPVEEDSETLSPAELAALFQLVRTPEEKHALLKALFLIWAED